MVLTVSAEEVVSTHEASVAPEDARDTDPGEEAKGGSADASFPGLGSRGFNKSRMCDRDELSFFSGVVVTVALDADADADAGVLLAPRVCCGSADTRLEMLYLLDRGVSTMFAAVAGVSSSDNCYFPAIYDV